jgi:thioredoxin 2
MNSVIVKCMHCNTKNRIPAAKQHLGPKCGKCKNRLEITDHAVVVELDDQSFNDFISQVSMPTMIDFFSPTCGPCQILAPVVERLAVKYIGRAIIAKLDTSRHPLTASHYGIRGVPTLLFFKGGQLQDQLTGAVPEQVLAEKIEDLL